MDKKYVNCAENKINAIRNHSKQKQWWITHNEQGNRHAEWKEIGGYSFSINNVIKIKSNLLNK